MVECRTMEMDQHLQQDQVPQQTTTISLCHLEEDHGCVQDQSQRNWRWLYLSTIQSSTLIGSYLIHLINHRPSHLSIFPKAYESKSDNAILYISRIQRLNLMCYIQWNMANMITHVRQLTSKDTTNLIVQQRRMHSCIKLYICMYLE